MINMYKWWCIWPLGSTSGITASFRFSHSRSNHDKASRDKFKITCYARINCGSKYPNRNQSAGPASKLLAANPSSSSSKSSVGSGSSPDPGNSAFQFNPGLSQNTSPVADSEPSPNPVPSAGSGAGNTHSEGPRKPGLSPVSNSILELSSGLVAINGDNEGYRSVTPNAAFGSNPEVSVRPGAATADKGDFQSSSQGDSGPQSHYRTSPAAISASVDPPFAVSSPISVMTVSSIGDQQVQVSSNNNIVIAGTMLFASSPGTTISSTLISLGSSALIGSSTYEIPAPSSPPLPSKAGQKTHQAPNSGIAIADTTLLPGFPATTISGSPVFLGPAGLVVDASTFVLPTHIPSSAIHTIVGADITAGPSSAFLLAGHTLSSGGPAVTVSVTLVSLNAAGLIVVESKTYTVPTGSQKASGLITMAGEVYTAASAGDSVVGTQTVVRRAPGMTVSGSMISLGGWETSLGG